MLEDYNRIDRRNLDKVLNSVGWAVLGKGPGLFLVLDDCRCGVTNDRES